VISYVYCGAAHNVGCDPRARHSQDALLNSELAHPRGRINSDVNGLLSALNAPQFCQTYENRFHHVDLRFSLHLISLGDDSDPFNYL